jgi:tetratricopeptide (TPR) repeat protein
MDAMSRNGGLDLTLQIARRMAASGGDILNLAKAELEAGNLARARWCYETALRRGSDSPDAYRLGLNLSLAQGMEEEFDMLLQKVIEDPGLLREIDLGSIVVSRAVRESDTLFIQRALEVKGPSPQLYNAFSAACAGSGDMDRAASYARAAVSHPEARAGQYAWAIYITASAGGDYDSIFVKGMDAFPGSVDIMLARLEAPLSIGEAPDREDLLRRCLRLSPSSPSVLRTAALWYLSAGLPDSSLKYSERAIASMGVPDPPILTAACLASASMGDTAAAVSHAAYAMEIHPGDSTFLHFMELDPAPESLYP